MERYAVTVDKDSEIRNDANDWSEYPRYIVDLVKRVVRVSVETVRIVADIPSLETQADRVTTTVAALTDTRGII